MHFFSGGANQNIRLGKVIRIFCKWNVNTEVTIIEYDNGSIPANIFAFGMYAAISVPLPPESFKKGRFLTI